MHDYVPCTDINICSLRLSNYIMCLNLLNYYRFIISEVWDILRPKEIYTQNEVLKRTLMYFTAKTL